MCHLIARCNSSGAILNGAIATLTCTEDLLENMLEMWGWEIIKKAAMLRMCMGECCFHMSQNSTQAMPIKSEVFVPVRWRGRAVKS